MARDHKAAAGVGGWDRGWALGVSFRPSGPGECSLSFMEDAISCPWFEVGSADINGDGKLAERSSGLFAGATSHLRVHSAAWVSTITRKGWAAG